ncbi:type I polyketide synthase [Streptomyces longisporus]|uniref:Polyketide synthase n=1 Tax=Streptomyces longisporus TaxID=1948 RepID=A0ABP5YK43_STRLO
MASEDKLRDYLKLVTANLRQVRRRLAEVEERSREPIAIVGIGCRFPGGADSPERLWDLLAGGTDAIGAFPQDRGWDLENLYDPDPDHPGTSYARHGGFVHDVAEFDAGFFGISPREALMMDPQQRLLLETSWEALEQAGIDAATLRGSRTGVFTGAYTSGYGTGSSVEAKGSEGHLLTGIATSVMSGRIAFSFGLEGPAVTVDTACSSSLVALHLAVQSLRSGECSLALVSGVTVVATPAVFVGFSRQRGMSVDGRCRSFSAEAEGSGWGEGVGVLVVERLSDARRNGHRVLAVVRGSAVNQDGASNGLTAPNGPSQQRVIRAALADAALSSADVDVVEAHGSATTLGDPIEADALIATYGQERPEGRPLWLGSVKSVIGHTQAAAGAAGMIKMVLALQHQEMPRTLHVGEPTPHVDWSAGEVRLLTEGRPWPAGERVRRAGVSAFGMSGTNVHVILEEAPAVGAGAGAGSVPVDGVEESGEAVGFAAAEPVEPALAVVEADGLSAWPVSGRSPEALAAQAGRLREWATARPEVSAADVAWSLATTRSVFEHRAVVVGGGRGELTAGLESLAVGERAGSVVSGVARSGGRTVFVFAGQGAQWVGMGRELAGSSPVFAARLAECERALAPLVEWSLSAVLEGVEGAPGLDRADVVQPVLWAVMVSLAAVWEAAGVVPDAVVGHSQGEVAAATVAGMLSLEDAARVVVARSKGLSGLSVEGSMVSVVMPSAAVSGLVDGFGGRLSVAAVNGPAAVVVSGEPGALSEFERELAARHVLRWRIPETDFVAHSAAVEPLEAVLAAELAQISPVAGRVPMVSTVTGEWITGEGLDAAYWYANLRGMVCFERATRVLLDGGFDMFVEVSPHPVLTGPVAETAEDAGVSGVVAVGTLERDNGGASRIVRSFAEAFVGGLPVDWRRVLPPAQAVELPTYAFQRQRYWLASAAPAEGGDGVYSPEEARFWAAVEEGDLASIADTLAIEDRHQLDTLLPALATWRRGAQVRSATGGWRYRVDWAPVSEPPAPVLSGHWLVVVPAAPTGEQLVDRCIDALTSRGARTVVARVPAAAVDRAGVASVLAEALGEAEPAGVLSLLALDVTPVPEHPVVPVGLAATVALVQALGDARISAPLWAVTSAAVAATPGEAPSSPAQAQVWGLGRVVALEHPERWGGLIDLPEALDERGGARLAAVLAGCGEDQAAIRQTGLLGRRLTHAPQPSAAEGAWRPTRGTALITGGDDAIGEHLARWLAERGAPRVVLIGSSGPGAPGSVALAAELAALGTQVDVLACDTRQRGELTGAVAWTCARGPALTAVLHTAEEIDAGPIDTLELDDLSSVLAAKAGAAARLEELTAGQDLDAFVLFSSVAAVWGGGRQPGFSAANAFLDALAERRLARGETATSVAWGPWSCGAMSSGDDGLRLERRGLRLMPPELAVQALAHILDGREGPVTVADVDWARFAPPFTLRRPSPLIADLPEVRQALADAAAGADRSDTAAADPEARTELKRRLADLPAADQNQALVTLVRTEAAAVLDYLSADAVGAGRPFSDLGFDSLTAVELRNRLSTATGLKLPATLLFDYPNPMLLAGYLRAELFGDRSGDVPAVAAAVVDDGDPIAIVGMACRFPGGVTTPEELWQLIASGTDAIGAFPQDRGWDLDALYDPDPDRIGTAYVRQGGFVYDAAEFDAGFFGISPREALAMDPQQRLLLETSWEALERAGIPQAGLRGSRTGVFVGASFAGYGVRAATDSVEAHLLTGTTTSVISGRVSYTLGLEGPALTVDTACSSALVAVTMACQSLRTGESSLALAGGAFVAASPDLFVWVSRQKGLAPDGRSKSFSAAADGMGISEGAGMVVLERLSDARRNGHPVLAVVRGAAVNQDGASNGLTAPNGPSQQRVIRAALANAGLTPSDVDVVEAHGSGTVLGDPIEAQAVIAAYGQDRPEGRPIWLGSVKSNIGHAQAAAGIGGLIKMVLALKNRTLPKSLHLGEASPHVDWTAGDVRLLAESHPWDTDGRPRRAGVSSFGVSGTNVHVIVEEEPAEQPTDPAAADGDGAGGDRETAVLDAPDALAWTVSGRTAESMRHQAARLAAHVAARPEQHPADLAWSLAATRSVFEYRTVITGSGREDLVAGLAAVAAGEGAPGVVTGTTAAAEVDRPVFVFPGQGAQWAGMGRELAASSPVFAARLAQCEQALAPYVDWSLTQVIAGADDAPPLERADVAQPALWAVMVSLAAVWEAAGVTPGAVIGHSQGEIAAAVVAGMLSLEDAAKVVAVRSQALSGLGTGGGMLSVVMPAAAVRELLAPWGDRLSVAAVNGPAATVVSGESAALAEFEAELSRRRVLRWSIPVTDFVAHSAGIDDVAGLLTERLAGIRPDTGRLPLFSTVECRWMQGAELDPGYWFANVRRTVRFDEAIRALAGAGHQMFIEVSPQPVLTTGIVETVEDMGTAVVPVVTGTLDREHSGPRRFLTALAQVHIGGCDIDWQRVLPAGRHTDLPTYAFQHQRYWLPAADQAGHPAPDGGAKAEARFWAAVEDGDLQQLADTLAVDGRQAFGEVLPRLAAWRRGEQEREVTENWRYRVTWAPVPDRAPATLTGTWLVAVPTERTDGTADLVDACVRALAAHGAHAEVVEVAAGTARREPLAAELARLVETARAEGAPGRIAGVVSLVALDERPVPGSPVVPRGLDATVTVLQAMTDAEITVPLWMLTAGAVSTGPGDMLTGPVQAQVWGLGRVVALEQPDRWGGLIDLPAALDDRAAARLVAVLAGCDEDQVAIRPSGIMGRRLTRRPPRRTGRAFTPRGTVLITGGTGAIGKHTARWLADRGAERLVLSSRSGPAATGAAHLAASLSTAGSDVQIIACDSAERAQLAGVIDRIASGGPALRTVLHTAGVLDDGVLDGLDTDRLAGALSAKAGGAAHLDELTAGLDLDAFVLFSSGASTFGGAGQSNYSAANAYLDGLAENRRARGLPALSVAWGPWAGEGVSQASEAARQRLRRNRWEVLMDPALAVQALGEAMSGSDTVLTVMDLDWPALADAPGAAEVLAVPFLRDLPDVQELGASLRAGGTGPRDEGELARSLAGLSRAEQDRALEDLVLTEAAAVLGYAGPAEVEPSRAFSELGFDSLTAVELRNRISRVTGLRLPATLLFDHPSPVALVDSLRASLLGASAATAAAPAAVQSASSADTDDPVVIVAMSCRYPGGIGSPDELWHLLAGGGDAVSGFPQDRGWDIDSLYDPDPAHSGTVYVREGGFLHQAAHFDAGFFGISPREALAMDPQQRLLLELSWEALESAGLDPASLRGSRTGVFVGGYSSNYASVSMQLAGPDGSAQTEGHLVTGNATSILSGRVSYVLGLEGPAVTVDTACSSSLVALHMAAQALRSGECSLALVGGVSVMATPWEMVGFARQRGLASDGRSKAFSADADGMGMGEGAGMLVVERLSDALRGGHDVLAVVRGSAINQDGASNGLTAPNGPSQQRVIRAALASAGLRADEIDAVEAHGTGTPLGDPIEAQALLATYGQERADREPLWLGSVKSNLGHTQAAAGVAGVIKMVLALRHGELPRTLHAEEPSPHVDWASGAVELLQRPRPWQAGDRVRRAGVSAFGISGTNAHVLLEEAPERAQAPAGGEQPTAPAVLSADAADAWVVSSRSPEGLTAQAQRLRAWTEARPQLEPADVAWSLATTRSVFEHRAVVVGGDREELTAGLERLADGAPGAGVVSGGAGSGRRVGLVFAGQGSQWLGMGRGLHESSPLFAQTFDQVSGLLELELGVSVRDVVLGAEGTDESLVDQTLYAQAGLFAFEVALAALLTASGLTADAVVGHSVGEIAAAYVAGVLSLPDACRLVAARARLMQALPGGGAMTAINAPEADVVSSMADIEGVSLAAVNGPDSVVVSGDPDAVARVAEHWREQGRRTRQLRVSHAFHSPAMDPAVGELERVAGELEHHRPRLLWAGALTGELVTACEPGYWPAQTRRTVRFADALATLAAQGITLFVEVGPDGSLSALGRDAVASAGAEEAVFVPLQRRTDQGVTGFMTGLARAFVHGAVVDWTAVLPPAQRVALPTYAFQHRHFWPEGTLLPPSEAGNPTAGADSAAEAQFWAVVEGRDLAGLADTLALEQEHLSEVLPALAAWRHREQDRATTANWRYRVTWTPVAEPGPGALSGTWLLVVPDGAAEDELTSGCAAAVAAAGAEVLVMETAETADHRRMAEQIRSLTPESGLSGVVSLLALDETPQPEHPAVANGLAGTQTLIQALIALAVHAPLWILTRGAVAAEPGEALANPAQAAAWGLARVSALEHPDQGGGLIDLPADFDQRAQDLLCSVLAGCGEDQAAIRPSGIFGRRLTRAAEPGAAKPWTPRGTTLITGGTGAIAGHVARWLADRGAPRLVLTSRSGPGAYGAAALAAELAAAGSTVEVMTSDAGDGAELTGVVERIGLDGPPLTAVMHAAGVPQATALDETSVDELASLMTAKAVGATLLDELTADLDLEAFVLFSSISATWGSGLQAGYAAANTYLDALAENRLSRGLPATSVAWGPWDGGGMTDQEDAAQMERRGLCLLEPAQAVRALAQTLDSRDSLVTVADVDWDRFAPPFTVRRPSPLIESLPEVAAALAALDGSDSADSTAGDALAARLAGLSRAEQDRLLTDLVRAEAAAVLGHTSIEAVQADRSFSDLGADSLTAVELRDRLNSATGLRLPSTLLFDYPTPAALAAYIWSCQANEASPARPVLAALDDLEGLLGGITADGDAAQITARLEVVLSKWKESRDTSAGQQVAEKLESSTDDEVFDFIGKELGIY